MAGHLTQCHCLGLCYILPYQKIFREYTITHYFLIVDKMVSRAVVKRPDLEHECIWETICWKPFLLKSQMGASRETSYGNETTSEKIATTIHMLRNWLHSMRASVQVKTLNGSLFKSVVPHRGQFVL